MDSRFVRQTHVYVKDLFPEYTELRKTDFPRQGSWILSNSKGVEEYAVNLVRHLEYTHKNNMCLWEKSPIMLVEGCDRNPKMALITVKNLQKDEGYPGYIDLANKKGEHIMPKNTNEKEMSNAAFMFNLLKDAPFFYLVYWFLRNKVRQYKPYIEAKLSFLLDIVKQLA